MNAVVQGSTADKPVRARQFGRQYDYENGTVTLTSAYDKNWKYTFSLANVDPQVVKSFAIQSMADYIVNEMNETLKDTEAGDEAARKVKALEIAVEAQGEIEQGQVDFRAGSGLGGARSAIGALGQVLFEMGKTFIVIPTGDTREEGATEPKGDVINTKVEFTDLHSARAAVKKLYTSTTAYGDKKLTGRMYFNAIQMDKDVAPKLAALRKEKKPVVGAESIMG